MSYCSLRNQELHKLRMNLGTPGGSRPDLTAIDPVHLLKASSMACLASDSVRRQPRYRKISIDKGVCWKNGVAFGNLSLKY